MWRQSHTQGLEVFSKQCIHLILPVVWVTLQVLSLKDIDTKQTKNFRFGSLSPTPFIICLALTVALARKSLQEHKHDRQYPRAVEISRQQRQFKIIIKVLQTVWLMYLKNWLLLQVNLASSFALASYLTVIVIFCSLKQTCCWMWLKFTHVTSHGAAPSATRSTQLMYFNEIVF